MNAIQKQLKEVEIFLHSIEMNKVAEEDLKATAYSTDQTAGLLNLSGDDHVVPGNVDTIAEQISGTYAGEDGLEEQIYASLVYSGMLEPIVHVDEWIQCLEFFHGSRG